MIGLRLRALLSSKIPDKCEEIKARALAIIGLNIFVFAGIMGILIPIIPNYIPSFHPNYILVLDLLRAIFSYGGFCFSIYGAHELGHYIANKVKGYKFKYLKSWFGILPHHISVDPDPIRPEDCTCIYTAGLIGTLPIPFCSFIVNASYLVAYDTAGIILSFIFSVILFGRIIDGFFGLQLKKDIFDKNSDFVRLKECKGKKHARMS